MAKPGSGKTKLTTRKEREKERERERERVKQRSKETPAPPPAASKTVRRGPAKKPGIAHLEDVFATLANPIAREILFTLLERDASARDLGKATGRSSVLASMYVSDFCRRGYVERKDEGPDACYRLVHPVLRAVLNAAVSACDFSGLA